MFQNKKQTLLTYQKGLTFINVYNIIKQKGDDAMGEVKFALKQIKKDLWFIGDLLLFAVGIYFTVQSVNNLGFFYYMYIKPIVDFIDLYILPLFTA